MARAEFHGRMQKITQGRVNDLITTYNLACNPRYELDPDLLIFKDGKHGKVIERKNELGFLGNLDGIIIGIAGADPPNIKPEQITPEWRESAKVFFDQDKNPLSYFQRMVALKQLVLSMGMTIEKVDILPKYPHHYYPFSVGLFESKPEDFAFQYLGVESDHHFHRVETKAPDERNITVLYHDFRNNPSSKSREVPINLNIQEFDEKVFNFYTRRFIPQDDGSFGIKVENSIEVMLENSEKKKRDLVLAIVCFPRKSDRDAYDGDIPLPPIETYMMLKDHLIKKGANLQKTHITFIQPDIIMGAKESRCESYMPKKFILNTEQAYNKNIANKINNFGNHPRCVGIKYTD